MARISTRILGFILLLAVVFLSSLFFPNKAEAQEEPRLLPIDVVLIIDQSGSMADSDPNSLRIDAARSFIDYLGSYAGTEYEHRVAVINFGSEVEDSSTIHLTPILSEKNRSLIKGQIVSKELGATNFRSAFRAAYEELKVGRSFESERKRAVVIFTDGDPYIDRLLNEEEVERYLRELTMQWEGEEYSTLIKVLVVGLDIANLYWLRDEPYWREIAPDTPLKNGEIIDHTIQVYSANDAKIVYWKFINELLEVEGEMLTDLQEVTVEPYLERITFAVNKMDPAVKVALYKDEGCTLVRPGNKVKLQGVPGVDRYEIWTIEDPEPGIWEIRISPKDKENTIEVYKTIIFARIKLIEPVSPYPLGKPVSRLSATLYGSDGKPVKEHPNYPLHFNVIINNGPILRLSAVGESGIYSYEGDIELLEGENTIRLVVRGGSVTIVDVEKNVLVSKNIPYFEIITPQDGYSYQIQSFSFRDLKFFHNKLIKVRLLMNEKPVNADIFDEPPDNIFVAELSRPNSTSEFNLNPDSEEGTGIFTRVFEPPSKPEKNILKVTLSGNLKSGLEFRDISEEITFSWYNAWWWQLLWVIGIIFVLLILYLVIGPRGYIRLELIRQEGRVSLVTVGRPFWFLNRIIDIGPARFSRGRLGFGNIKVRKRKGEKGEVYLNGHMISKAEILKQGDIIKIQSEKGEITYKIDRL